MPPGLTRSAATRSSSSWSSGSGSRAPAQVGPARRARRGPSTARRRARGRSRSARPAARVASALTTVTLSAPSRRQFSSSSRARPGWSSTATTSPASCVALPPGRGAEVERALALARADDEPGELRAAALRPDQPRRERLLVDALDVQRVRQIRIGPPVDVAGLAAVEPHDALRRLVLRAHQRERVVAAELAPTRARRPSPDTSASARPPPACPRRATRAAARCPPTSRRMTAFVNATARSSRAARTSSTVSLTAACVATSVKPSWYAPSRSAARTGGSSLRTGRLPSVSIAWSSVRTRCTVPKASRCASARSRSSSSRRGAAEHAVGVRVVLEDAQHDLVRRLRAARHRRPRRNSS